MVSSQPILHASTELMKIASTDHCFVEHKHGCVCFPWAGYFVLGAPWAYDVPSLELRSSLLCQLRACQHVANIILAMSILAGIGLDVFMPCAAAGLAVSQCVYSLLIRRHLKCLVRLPLHLSMNVFAARLGRHRLSHNILMGIFCVAVTILFSLLSANSIALTAMTIAFAANSVVALHLFQYLPETARPYSSERGEDNSGLEL